MAKKGKSGAAKPKRVRRKCSAPGCINRVVQGGVCVTHGAKRKMCSHPGCAKAVKLAGLCSTHGPARRRCDAAGCTRVAVQGGRCLSHGARRRVCCYPLSVGRGSGGKEERCTKNAIMGGMCKKHYDRVRDAEGMLEMSLCIPVGASAPSFPSTGAVAAAASVSGSAGGSSCFESGEEEQSLGSTPSCGSAALPAAASSEAPLTAMAMMSVGEAAVDLYRRSPKKLNHHYGHQRGLSIFDEMPTVDAIINSGAEKQQARAAHVRHPQTAHPVSSAVPHASTPAIPQVAASSTGPAMPAKTPSTQVTFADCTSLPSSSAVRTAHVKKEGDAPCTGTASCTCKACRSPTLAIFEQMIQASQKLERGDYDGPAGLSPPKLSPRKASAAVAVAVASSVATPKNVSWLPEEPSSSGSVVRKVSSNNMDGMESGWTPQDYRQDYQDHRSLEAQGPASHALATLARVDTDADMSRTVSHDVDDGSKHSNIPHPSAHRNHHQHNYVSKYSPPSHYPYHLSTSANYNRGREPPPPHYSLTTPHDFHPPQTPSLYESSGGQPPMVVSSHSTHHESLLPRPRAGGSFGHLFIPKEV